MSLLPGIWGQDAACLAVLLAAVNPAVGGVLLAGPNGTAKSTIARWLRRLQPTGRAFVTLPLSASEESLVGGIDLERTVKEGRRAMQPGLIARAKGGALFIDDLHLLPRDLAGLLANCEDALLVATANLADGEVSPHLLDRFGLAAAMAELKKPGERHQVLTAALNPPDPAASKNLARRIAKACDRLADLPRLSEAVRERICALVEEAGCPGHRGDLFLAEAARALAAWELSPAVTTAHVERIAPLVLDHRRRERRDAPPPPPPSGDDPPKNDNPPNPAPPPSSPESAGAEEDQNPAENDQSEGSPSESSTREEVMAIGEAFAIRRMALAKDRLRRRSSGRRTKSHVRGPDGRSIRAASHGEPHEIHLGATLRAAAPFQFLRGRADRVLIDEEDLRYHRRERRIGHLVLFVVDGSGSMGAQRRMVAVKGAVHSLLIDCYQKRDRVALIVFRKDHAELALPPTRSVELANRRLATMPVGGKTPLAAGLAEAQRVAERERRREPETRVLMVLLSDGRANHAANGAKAGEEATRAARALRAMPGLDSIVVDTEDKRSYHRTDMARGLAGDLGAVYSTIEGLAAPDLAALVRQARRQTSTV